MENKDFNLNNKIHFHTIDALRFFAFFKVYLLHVPIQGEFPIFAFLKSGGGIGVSFFFVLSGFLITYLLLAEKIAKQQINVRRFFVRRSLRIWPLFYLMVILAFLLPYELKQNIGLHMVGGGYEFDWKFSFSFLENYKMLLLDNSPKTTPLQLFWSLCIEEHFYITWLVLLYFLPLKHTLKFLLSCFAIAWVARFIEPHIFNNQIVHTNDLFTNIDYFASGGILAYFVAKDYAKISKQILSIPNWIKWFTISFVTLIVIFQKQLLLYDPGTLFFIFRPSIIAILFTLLIAIFIPQNSSIRINSPLLSYLGVRSYGLYVYHLILIHISFQYCLHQNIKIDNWLTLSSFILVTLGGSIIISILSYKYFEKPFLKLRKRVK